jgi:hypothetical protein
MSTFGCRSSDARFNRSEATRLELTVVFSLFMSWGNTGTVLDLAKTGTTDAYDFGELEATRYAGYPNIVWHVMGDFGWSFNQGPGRGLDAIFHGIKDAEGPAHRLIIAEPANGSTSFNQFISEEGARGYRWFTQSADTVYDYGSNSVEQFDKVFNRAGAAKYPVVDIEPSYVNAPHFKDQQKQELRERNYTTFIRGGAGINFGHEKWWPFGVTGLFGNGGPNWLNIITEPPQLCARYAWTLLDSLEQPRGERRALRGGCGHNPGQLCLSTARAWREDQPLRVPLATENHYQLYFTPTTSSTPSTADFLYSVAETIWSARIFPGTNISCWPANLSLKFRRTCTSSTSI